MKASEQWKINFMAWLITTMGLARIGLTSAIDSQSKLD